MEEIFLKNSDKILRKISSEDKDFRINLAENSNIKFWAVIKNSKISIIIDAENENSKLECYFLIPAIDNQETKLDIQTIFKSKDTRILVNIFALATDNASITLDGNLHIWDGINNVEARLYEETLLLWKAKYISLIPWLRVDSPDIVASHWAKIQRISPERLFYMQSRGLSQEKAVNMIINSYSQQIIEKLELNEQEQSEFYSMID